MTETGKKQALLDVRYLTACAIHGMRPEKDRVAQMDMAQVYRMSRFHMLTGITFEAVSAAYGQDLPDTPVLENWREDKDKAITKNLLLDAERMALLDWMEQTGIWYLPLKGCILKEFYPKPGMRQMADNDILFDAAYQEQVRDWFVGRGYEIGMYQSANNVHDVYLKEPVYNFEMHTALFEDHLLYHPENEIWADGYKNVKQRLLPDEGKRFGYHFSDEDFYVYIIAHALKHHRNKGTGLRTLLDFYVYLGKKGRSMNRDHLRAELARLKLAEFERCARGLAEKLFADPEHFQTKDLSDAERKMFDSCLFAGAYGTKEQSMRNRVAQLTGEGDAVTKTAKWRYLRKRLLPDRRFMEHWCTEHAAFFLRHAWLMPLAYAWRILRNGLLCTRSWVKELRILRRIR